MSEVERLRWEHVQLHKRRLYFIGAKTFEYRYVPLLANTADLLAALKPGKPGDLVFRGFDDRTARARAWRRAAVTAGCGAWHCRQCGTRLVEGKCAEHGERTERESKYKGPEFCHTRHTAARNLTNKGVPLPRVMQTLGHKNVPVHLGYNLADESDLDLIHELYDGGAKPGPQKVRLMRRKAV
jgi:integrase